MIAIVNRAQFWFDFKTSSSTDRWSRSVGRRTVLESKTSKHPVTVGDFLLVSNGEATAAFRLHVC
jgi:hypothetical protein